jgi:hypothetical protein
MERILIEGASTILPVQHLLYHKSADAFVGVAFEFFAILAFYFLGSAVAVSMIMSSASGCVVCEQQSACQSEYTPYTRFEDNIWS